MAFLSRGAAKSRNVRTFSGKCGPAEENQETVRGSIDYFGTYSIDPRDDTLVTFQIEGSTFPNWEGARQKRVLKVTGDEMNYTNPTISTGSGVARLVWKRAR